MPANIPFITQQIVSNYRIFAQMSKADQERIETELKSTKSTSKRKDRDSATQRSAQKVNRREKLRVREGNQKKLKVKKRRKLVKSSVSYLS